MHRHHLDHPDQYGNPVIILPNEDLADLRMQQTMIQQAQHTLASLQRTFITTVEMRYNVDLGTGDWEMDIEKGLLRHVSLSEPEPA
jgi:hypothetical protein